MTRTLVADLLVDMEREEEHLLDPSIFAENGAEIAPE
jgi:hypothetical protein